MLEEFYNSRQEIIDGVIKDLIRNVQEKLIKIDESEMEKNRELVDKIEENCNIKMGVISKEVYLLGLSDGIHFILEAKEKNI